MVDKSRGLHVTELLACSAAGHLLQTFLYSTV